MMYVPVFIVLQFIFPLHLLLFTSQYYPGTKRAEVFFLKCPWFVRTWKWDSDRLRTFPHILGSLHGPEVIWTNTGFEQNFEWKMKFLQCPLALRIKMGTPGRTCAPGPVMLSSLLGHKRGPREPHVQSPKLRLRGLRDPGTWFHRGDTCHRLWEEKSSQ